MRRLPPLNALKAFEATARLSSVTAAAEELGVSHSAVSQQITLLEDYFGQKLFLRPGRRVEPTPAALAFLEDVRVSLDRLAVAGEQLTRRGVNQILTVNATPSFAMCWLIPRLAVFQASEPAVEVRITTSYSDGITHLDGPFDFIIRREAMSRSGYICRRLLDDKSTPVMSPSFQARAGLNTPADFLRSKLLHLRSRPDAWKRWLVQNGVNAPETLDGPYLDHFFLTIQAAASGMGVAIAPLAFVETNLREGALVAPFRESTLDGPGFHVLHRSELIDDRGGRKVLRWLEQDGAGSSN